MMVVAPLTPQAWQPWSLTKNKKNDLRFPFTHLECCTKSLSTIEEEYNPLSSLLMYKNCVSVMFIFLRKLNTKMNTSFAALASLLKSLQHELKLSDKTIKN